MSAHEGGVPLSCKEVTGLVTDAMEGALPAGTEDAYAEHLVACEACRTFAQQVAQTVEVLRRLARGVEPEPDERLMAAFRNRSRRPQ